MSKQSTYTGPAGLFNIPKIAAQYFTGKQVNNPGETVTPWQGAVYHAIPWPNVVPTVNALAFNVGTPTERAGTAVNNSIAPGFTNPYFLAGVVGKSQG